MWSTVEEQEVHIGEQIRARRLRGNLTVRELADHAGLAPRTVQNLERGRGSTLTTLVKVLRALDADDWLETLTPDEPVSPVAILQATQAQRSPRQRARRNDG